MLMASRTLIIAEAGVNHNGDLNSALLLVDAAADAGADIVKFQTFNAKRLVTQKVEKANYQNIQTGNTETQFEMLRKLELSVSAHHQIMARCALRNIGFLSTGFDIQSIDLLVSLGQTCFKVPSGEITNFPYLRYIGQLRKSVILSTGMSTLQEVDAALSVLEAAGTSRKNVTVLHCTTEYPAPVAEVNLRVIQTLAAALGVSVGYSDHTEGIDIAVGAVAMGATVIEKHFTLDRKLPGPDHRASLEPRELALLVMAIRRMELALGDGIKQPTQSELKNMPVIRKSLVANQFIKKGDIFTVENLTTKRPGTGISPMQWDNVIGLRSPRDFAEDELIEL